MELVSPLKLHKNFKRNAWDMLKLKTNIRDRKKYFHPEFD